MTPPIVAAIYARKSNDQNVADEQKSVARQVARQAVREAQGLAGQRGLHLHRRRDHAPPLARREAGDGGGHRQGRK
jgi:hypothetical protein